MLCSSSIPVNIEQDYCSHQTKSLIKQVVQYDYHKRVISVAVVVAFWLEGKKCPENMKEKQAGAELCQAQHQLVASLLIMYLQCI